MPQTTAVYQDIVKTLKTIYDPELPVNIYDLGLIYDISIDNAFTATIEMTLTSPSCPIAGTILEQVKNRVELIDGVNEVFINLTFEPPWGPERMTDEAKLELGFL